MINQTVCVVSDFAEGEQKDINNYRHIQLHLLYKDKTVCVTDHFQVENKWFEKNRIKLRDKMRNHKGMKKKTKQKNQPCT